MYRWSLYTGGPCVQVVLVYRWSLCTGGLCVQVTFKTGPTVFFNLSPLQLTTPQGKGRALVRLCLCDGKLADCVQNAVNNEKLTR